MELIVLGASGSYNGRHGPCSGYLVRTAEANLWVDCGNGTLSVLHEHVDPAEVDAIVISHEHPDHCADLYGMHVLWHYGLERTGLPVLAPEGAEHRLGALVRDWGGAFDWRAIDPDRPVEIKDARLAFSRTDHPIPTYAVEIAGDGRRLVYTADTGPGWDVGAFAPGADLVLSEASHLHAARRTTIHLSAREAGEAARAAGAGRLVLTHVWPTVDLDAIGEEGSAAFGAEVVLAAPHVVATL